MFSALTDRQREFSDISAGERIHENIDFRGSPVHELIRDLPIRRLMELLRQEGHRLDGQRILIVGCGFGTDIYYLRRYADIDIVATDISIQNTIITRKSFDNCDAMVADSELLPFADNSFDYVFICDSLHHMARPYLGIYEMLRVANRAICIIEPHDCALTKLATRVGLMQEYEEAGNYVLKLNRHDIARLARSLFVTCKTTSIFATDFGLFERLPLKMREFIFPIFRTATALINAIMPSQGNTFIGAIFK